MVKTNRQKKQKQKTNKQNKTKKISGGRPKFIKMYAQHTEKGNVVYRFVYDDFNEEDQKKIFEQDKVYYSVKNDDSLMDELKNQIDVLNEEVRLFFYKKPLYSNDTSKKDYKTIIIRNKKELKKIEIAEKIIENMKKSVTRTSTVKYDNDIPGFIKEYKKFIDVNKDELLTDIEKISVPTAWKMLNTPAFLNIIGIRYKFIENELSDNLDNLKEQMDSSSEATTATTATTTATTTAAATTSSMPPPPPQPQPFVPKSLDVTLRLKRLVKPK
jgi:hypothetical protein